MTNSKNTKKALLSSVLAMLMCVAMLIGSTFAWFTDSVSTGKSRIVAGNLDVDLIDAEGNSLEGKVLNFVKAEGAEDEEILWEPGCTYNLPAVSVKNNGNLALKYRIVVNGVEGDEKLLEAIEFTAKLGGEAVKLDDYVGHLEAGETSAQPLVISGHMKETAGNEYKGLTAEGISITVIATQDTVESDSFNNQYDADAEYPVVPKTVSNAAELSKAIQNAEDGDVILLSSDKPIVITDKLTVDKNLTLTGDGDTEVQNLRITTAGQSELSVENLDITENSYIDTNGGASSVSLNNCNINVNITDNKITGRAAFLVLGANENNASDPVKLNITGNTFAVKSTKDSYAAAIFGWNYVADGSVISGNTFGSENGRYAFIAVKLMNFADGANIDISKNTIYGTNASFGFYAFDMYQNNSRSNAYTATFSDNTIDIEKLNANDAYFIDLEVNEVGGVGGNATIIVAKGNTLNGQPVTSEHILIEQESAGKVIYQ